MPLLLRDGDTGSHGGTVTSGASKTFAEGSKVVLDGDILDCDVHGNQAITNPISTKTYAEGSLIALDGSVAACGATITASNSKTFAE